MLFALAGTIVSDGFCPDAQYSIEEFSAYAIVTPIK
jgi:hypothetical protein